MNRDYNRLRKKVGIDKLNDDQRKKLFYDFVDHGGEVVDEKPQEKGKILKALERKKTKEGKKIPAHMREFLEKTRPSQHTTARKAAAVKTRGWVSGRRKKAKAFSSLKIYMKGLFSRVFNLGGNRFSDKFIHFFCGEGKSHALNLHLTVKSFLDGKNSVKKDIWRLSTGENSTFYEFLIRLSRLYDDIEYSSIENAVTVKEIPRGPYREVFKMFFKRIYTLGQFHDMARFYAQKAVDIQESNGKINAKNVSSVKKKLGTDINVILGEYLPSFHVILCKMNRVYYPLYSQELDDFLGITDEDKIGYITRIEKKKRSEELKKMRKYLKKLKMEAQEKGSEELKIPKHVERGLPLIRKSIEEYEDAHRHDEENPLDLLDKNDKMYKSALLLEVFDKEYSFILTSGKIGFNIDYREQKKVDIKEDFTSAYLLLSEARHDVKDYFEIMRETKRTAENLRLTFHQKSTMQDSLGKKQSVTSRRARKRIAETMKSIQSILSTVIDDYNTANRLLQNPDETLLFNEKIDEEKKFQNKKVIEAIVEIFLFSSTFAFLLNYGELSGSGITIEPDIDVTESTT